MSKQGICAGDTHSFRTVRRYHYASPGPGEPVLLGIRHPPDDVVGGSGILSSGILSSGAWLRDSASPTDHLQLRGWSLAS